MAKKSWIARDKKKADTVKRYAELRTQLKAEKDYIGLTMLPRNASPTRTVNRCLVSGRRRAFIRRFKLYFLPRTGQRRHDPRCDQVQLVRAGKGCSLIKILTLG